MPLQILVVDDEPIMRQIVAGILSHHGHAVSEAGDGRAALALADSARFDIVVSDLEMPVMDGLSLLRELRQAQPLARCIVLTGHGRLEEALAALRAGAVAFVVKPVVDPKALLDAVELAAGQLRNWLACLAALQRGKPSGAHRHV